MSARISILRLGTRLLGRLAVILCLFAGETRAATDDARKRLDFDIPANDAVTALRHFASQSGVQVIYSGSTVAGVRTARVKGRFTPREALDRMLAGTRLVVKQDEKTGAIAIMPATSRPGANPPAEKVRGDRRF